MIKRDKTKRTWGVELTRHPYEGSASAHYCMSPKSRSRGAKSWWRSRCRTSEFWPNGAGRALMHRAKTDAGGQARVADLSGPAINGDTDVMRVPNVQ